VWLWFLGAFTKFWKATITFVLSICRSPWNNSAPTGRIFMKFDHCVFFFFFKSVDKIQVSWIYCRSNGYFTWLPISIFDHISLVSSSYEKCFRQKFVEKIKTHIFCSITCCTEDHAIYDLMWKYIVDPNRHQGQEVAWYLHARYLRLQTHTLNM